MKTNFPIVLALLAFTLHTSRFTLHAQSVITATYAVTNSAGTTNGNTVIVQGTTYLWTNSPSSLSHITNSGTAPGAATNLYNKFRTALTNRYMVSYGSSTSVLVKTYVGQTITSSISTNWGLLTFATNTAGNASLGASNLHALSITLGGTTIDDWTDVGSGGTSGALTNNETRAVTFESTLTIGGASSQNPIAPSAGQLTFANSILVDGAFIQGRTIIGTNFVGNGAGLTNLPDVATQAGLAAGSYVVNGALATNFAYLPVYNVDLYGADHNPAGTNDHWAIQRAVDAATNTGGGVIYFPGGDYWVSNTTFHPTFRSENARSAITLHSNCSWVLLGNNNATIKLQDTTAGPDDLVIIGSGNVNVGSYFVWKAADYITLKGLTFDMMNRTVLYDMTEIHDGHFFLAENCKFINNLNTTADAVDATGETVVARNCVYSNWNGSIFNAVNNGAGVAVFENNYVTNCNVDFTKNVGFDSGAGSSGMLIDRCNFANVGKVMNSEPGRHIRIKDSTFKFMSHAGQNPATNIQIRGEVEITGCRFGTFGTANNIGCIVLDGNLSTGKIINNQFVAVRAVWATNTLDFEFRDNRVVAGISPLLLGGTGRNPYIVSDNYFGTTPSAQIHVFENGLSSTPNLEFSGNTCVGFLVKAYGTNWTFRDNTINNTTTGYIDDNGNANTRFIGNVTIPFGNAANELRMSGASNYVSGNVVNDVAVYSTAIGSYFCDNVVETGNLAYYSGSAATFRSGNAVIRNNWTRNGTPFALNQDLGMFTNAATVTVNRTLHITNYDGSVYRFQAEVLP